MKYPRTSPALAAAAAAVAFFAFTAFGQECGSTDYDCAIRKNQAALNSNPNDIERYFDLGIAYKGKADDTQAITMFDKYLAGTGIKPEYRATLALADFTRALELLPRTTTFMNRATTYRKLGKVEWAAADEKKAAELQ